MAAAVMATATATVGGGSDDNNGAALDAKGGGAEVIGVDRNNKDCSADARFLLTAVIVDRGGNGMEPIEPIGVDEGCGKDAITAAAIYRRCS